ncbi:cilia- and flagella-associated protein 119 [Chanos chanos]|uniref:Cilia- and flagella-associated protein 119 n=1 Tax=Chanos chanos TaxID=29144 RepID=A0A6J2VIV3_CHACN|nr:coiled-coil domain-containing protein 189 [Chanos chanos]
MEEIDKIESDATPELERILCRALGVEAAEPRRGILVDLYLNILLFCREMKYNKEQTSVLLSIVKNVHQTNAETSFNNMDDCWTYLTHLLLCHSVTRPPFSISLFSSEQVTQFTKYFINTYMRHYVLYKYIFTPQVCLDLSLSYCGLPQHTAPDQEAFSECVSDGLRGPERESTEADTSYTDPSEIVSTCLEKIILSPSARPSSKAELRTIVQQEVKEEVMRLTAQLQQRLQESAEQLNSALVSLETNLKSKK